MKVHLRATLLSDAFKLLFVTGMMVVWPVNLYAENSDLRSFGDIMQVALPAAGLVGTFVKDDPEGRHQWAWAVGSTVLTVQTWKAIADKARPDAAGSQSFPSGHTSGAFTGAAFINERYGPWWGVPAYICAAITGYSRIDADAHFWDDVVAGASTAMMLNWYFTTSYSEKIALVPAVIDNGYGVKLTFANNTESSAEKRKTSPGISTYPLFTYIFKFGPAWQDKNVVRAPNRGGTEFDFAVFENIEDPMTTSDISLDIRLAERHKLLFGFAPYENRDYVISEEEFTFADTVFPGDETSIRSSYRLFELRGQYSYGLFLDDNYSVFVGAGLAWEDVTISIQEGDDLNDPVKSKEVDDSVFLPYVYLRSGYNVTDRIEGFLEMDGIALDQDKMFNLYVGANYHFNRHWYAGGGYAYSYRQIDTDDLYNEFEFQGILAHVAYTF